MYISPYLNFLTKNFKKYTYKKINPIKLTYQIGNSNFLGEIDWIDHKFPIEPVETDQFDPIIKILVGTQIKTIRREI